MGEGRRTAKTQAAQAVCLELSPLCSILGFSLPTLPSFYSREKTEIKNGNILIQKVYNLGNERR